MQPPPPPSSGTAATFSVDSSFSAIIIETNVAQTVTGKINVIDQDVGEACLDLARTLGYSATSDYYKTGEATGTGSYYGSKTIFSLLSNNQLAVISDGDPYPAKAGSTGNSNDLITQRWPLNFPIPLIEQDFEYKFTYRGGDLNSDASYSDFNSSMGIQGIFLNGVAFYNPSAGNGTIPGTTISGNNTYNLNPIFFEDVYGIDTAGGHPSEEGNIVNGEKGQYHYHDAMILTSGAWNNETFASSNTYFSSDYYTDASGNIDYIRHTNGHSKIVGFCFDGYPIYGPYGYDGSFNSNSPSVLMTTSYQTLQAEFDGRPYTYTDVVSGDGYSYTLSAGAFIDDYEHVAGLGSLDECNGRFCVTPEYPNGTYAYFSLINEEDESVFPYFVGKYSRQQRNVNIAGYPADTHNTGGSVTPTTGTAGVFSVSTLGVSKYVSSPIDETVVDVSYGSFTIDVSGNWSYTMDGPHDEFVTDVSYNDSITVYSYDGSANHLITVTMTGTNDAAIISGTSVGAISESDAVQSVSGILTIGDADAGESLFVARTSVAGSNGYGSFTIDASGNWSYTMNNAHDEFIAGQTYTDSITVSSVDGSANQVITVTMTGTNDAAVIFGTSVGAISESDAVQSVSGILTIGDADAGESLFVARTSVAGSNGFGSFTIDASGNWSYTMNNAHDEFIAGQTYTDSITVSRVDGTATQVITVTMTGTNDAAIISGTSVGAISETNAVQSVSGSLTVADSDAGETIFVARTSVAGSNGFGSFTIDASGNWSYTMNNAHDEFIAGQTYTDSITVSSVDGSANQVITVTMTGTNDIPTIGGQNTGSIIQSNEEQSVSGVLSVTDLDAGESSFVPQTNVSGNNNYGSFTIDASGNWTYTMNNAHTEFAAGQTYTDSITVYSYDGSANQVITVTMTGTNNAPVITSTNTSQVTTAVGTSSAVYTVTSTDVDENNILTYSISGGTDASLCNIGSTTGAVTFKANPTVGTYYITVKVADENSAYDTKAITITVTSETAANHTALTADSNVCFPAKTPVMTNQGPVNIEDIDPAVHTIRNKKIVAITKTVAHDKNLVRIAKHALGHLYPEKTTTMSQNHKVFFQGQMVKAKHLVNEDKGITLVPYKGEILYNVLLEQHEKMQVNNLIVETLHPEHKVAKLYRFLKNVDAAHHGKLIALFNKKDKEHRLSTCTL